LFVDSICQSLILDYKFKFFPLVSFWGGLVSMEMVKFTGKYTPFVQGPLMFEFYSQFKLNR
jgi:hypothetical protein